MVDAFSKWPEVIEMSSNNTAKTIEALLHEGESNHYNTAKTIEALLHEGESNYWNNV